jgi:fucose permease
MPSKYWDICILVTVWYLLIEVMIGIGATIAPIIATQFVSRGFVWSDYYFITLATSTICIFAVGLSFRNEHSTDGSVSDETRRNAQRGKLGIAVRRKITWIASTFIFLYQGAEVALGGWLVTFMIQVSPP